MATAARYLAASVFFLAVTFSHGQEYPAKPVRLVAADAGGGGDVAARLIAQGMAGGLGQPVIVDNRGGAAGMIAAQTVARAAPDGYTLLIYSGTVWILPFLRSNVPYDPVKDFLPITLAVNAPNILVVHPSLPVKSVKDLITLARSKPGMLNYGTTGPGSTSHLATELFKAMAGVDIVTISYKGTSIALNDLIRGQLQLMFTSPGGAMAHINSGRMRALAVTTLKPSVLLPGLPTVAGTGLPGYESSANLAMFAPAKTSGAILSRLNLEAVRVLGGTEVKEKLLVAGWEVVGSTAEQLTAIMASDMAKIGKLIRDKGIRAE